MEKKNKLTRLELYWILYDVGNSAFVLMVSTLLPIYFNSLADSAGISSSQYLSYWGYAASVSTLIVAVLGPVFGTLADTGGYKKPIFTAFMMLGVIGCAALSVPTYWLAFLVVFVIAKVGFNASLVFYDSMLTDITTPERMDNVSSQGYAWGYIGSVIPFIISLVLVLNAESFGISMTFAMAIAFFLTAGWWLCMTLPLLKNYKQVHFVEKKEHAVRESFARLGQSLKEIRRHKGLFLFLISFFLYIDGVYTIIEMATAYGEALGLDSTMLLLALLLTQFVAFPFALLFGKLAGKYKNSKLIRICILAYAAIALFAIQLDKAWEFWLLAVCVGIFQGGIQALSRSYFAQIIPPEKAGEFFGLLDICGKGASFMGTGLVAVVTSLTGRMQLGVAMISVLIIAGYLVFRKAAQLNADRE
ncbi:MAG: MFS transporter [Lachnospiraceae bacterium]|nr:MFS transporter [Lachnospiraceae bacterium]